MNFSLIICTYNVSRKLPKTLDALLHQKFSDFEVMVVDGGSTDGTVEVIKEYEKKYNGRLRWVSEKDTGIYNAMNKGVQMARGEYIGIIGAGDWYEEDALENIWKGIQKYPEADAMYGKTRVWDADRRGSRVVQTMPNALPAHPMQHPALFYKKSLHERFGMYDESYRIVSDYLFCLKAFSRGNAVVRAIDAVVVNFVMDGVSSQKAWQCLREGMRAKRDVGISVNYFSEVWGYLKERVRQFMKDGLPRRELLAMTEDRKLVHPLRPSTSLRTPPPEDRGRNKNVPVFVISFNRLKYLQKLIAWLERAGFENIHIVDNASTYPLLLEYLKATPHKVHRVEKGYKHLVVWECGRFSDIIDSQEYIVTDCDVLPIDGCPSDVARYFSDVLKKHRWATKVGFSLKIDDIPDSYAMKDSVTHWEGQFWRKKVGEGLYEASIDTTFALYRPGIYPTEKRWWKSIRAGYPYTARHLPWYEDTANPDSEDIFYQKNIASNRSTFWSVTDAELLKKYNAELVEELRAVYASGQWKFLRRVSALLFFFFRQDRFKRRAVEKRMLLERVESAEVRDLQKRNGEIVAELGTITSSGMWRFLMGKK